MNKKDYAELHRLLAILKYELQMNYYDTNNEEYRNEIDDIVKAIDILMKVFIVECDNK